MPDALDISARQRIHGNDELGIVVFNALKAPEFPVPRFLIGEQVSRLDIDFFVAPPADKIDLASIELPYGHVEPGDFHVDEDKILDGFMDISLAETDERMTQSEILEIIFLAISKIFFPDRSDRRTWWIK
jgi:hypothetical protein